MDGGHAHACELNNEEREFDATGLNSLSFSKLRVHVVSGHFPALTCSDFTAGFSPVGLVCAARGNFEQ